MALGQLATNEDITLLVFMQVSLVNVSIVPINFVQTSLCAGGIRVMRCGLGSHSVLQQELLGLGEH